MPVWRVCSQVSGVSCGGGEAKDMPSCARILRAGHSSPEHRPSPLQGQLGLILWLLEMQWEMFTCVRSLLAVSGAFLGVGRAWDMPQGA